DLADAVTAGRREEFADFSSFTAEIPDPQAESTFLDSRLDWGEAATRDGRRRRALWRDLLALRAAQPALRSGRRDLVEALTVDKDCLALLRRDPDGQGGALIAVNLAEAEQQRGLRIAPVRWSVLLSSDDSAYGGAGAAATMTAAGSESVLTLPPRSATILTARPSS
ncbi:MAG TPA: DUF3459 domain-containing protein, partial [Egibacteraceae bacterium]|nr:DUF3459 domain-containing protein [Egibacteraceae bacterium]